MFWGIIVCIILLSWASLVRTQQKDFHPEVFLGREHGGTNESTELIHKLIKVMSGYQGGWGKGFFMKGFVVVTVKTEPMRDRDVGPRRECMNFCSL